MTDNPDTITPAADGPTLHRIAERVLNRPLLMHPDKVSTVLAVLQGRMPIDGMAPAPDANRFIGRWGREDGGVGYSRAQGGVSIIPVIGSLVNRGAWIGASSGLTSYEGLSHQLRDAANDPEIHSIVLDIDSPGGEATGMFALAEQIRGVAAQKPVVALVNDMAASAAYGIASAATEIVVSPTSMVGSIGVVLTHVDRSAEMESKGLAVTLIYAGQNKVDGNPFGPLPDQVQADMQRMVGQFYDQFIATVAAGRGERFTAEQARATEARVFLGAEAVSLGLADRVASLDALLADLSARGGGAPSQQRSMTTMNGQTKTGAPQADNGGITQEAHDAATAAARAEGEKAGASAERARIGAILTHAEAADRPKLASHLALETDMPAEAAGAMLAKAAKETEAKGGMSPAEANEGLAEFGADAGTGAGKPDKAAAADAAWQAAHNDIFGA